MSLALGTRLGPYELIRPVGAGAMGEVFEARDHRLGRSVAVKAVAASATWKESFLHRFEQEGKLLAQLNHPNILSLYDVVHFEDRLFLVTEFLEGTTLRDRMKGRPLPLREALDIAHQVAHGLAAAHDKGLIHRDLKPENIFLTRDGRAKLLDFGLAKLMHPDQQASALPKPGDESTIPSGSSLGIIGTPCYMSPEQANGDPLDNRTDIFSLGIVLWEMLAGHRPYAGDGIDVLYAIARQDAPDFPAHISIPYSVHQVLRRCLARNPAQRVRSAYDLAFALEPPPLQEPTLRVPQLPPDPPSGLNRRQVLGMAGVGLGLAGASAAAGWLMGRRTPTRPSSFTPLTFGQGLLGQARFVPGEHTVIFSASWQGRPFSVYSLHSGAPEARDLGFETASMLAVSAKREIILSQDLYQVSGDLLGKSSLAALAGSAPRPLADSTIAADFSADGERLGLLVQERMSQFRLEYPIGTTLYTSPQVLGSLRIGTAGLALSEREGRNTNSGWIRFVGRGAPIRSLTRFRGFTGLAWGPDGNEVWYSEWWGGESTLWAVDLSGRKRRLMTHGGRLDLHDVDASGRVLASLTQVQKQAYYQGPRDPAAVNIGWYDGTAARGISGDGNRVLLTSTQDRLSIDGPLYLRPTNGSAALRLGTGFMDAALSRDGAWASTLRKGKDLALLLIPTGGGSPRTFELPGMNRVGGLQFFPDGRSLLLLGDTKDVDSAMFTLGLEDGSLRLLAPGRRTVFHSQEAISPDGRWLAYNTSDMRNDPPYLRGTCVGLMSGGGDHEIQGLLRGEAVFAWGADARSLLVFNRNIRPTPIHLLDPWTGDRRQVRILDLAEPSGVWGLQSVKTTPNADHFAFNVQRNLSNLFLIEGLG